MAEEAVVLPQKTNGNSKRKRNWIIGSLVFLFLLLGIAFVLYWLLVLQFEETTDDAYVQGNQIVITPQISGFVSAIFAEETNIVLPGTLLVSLDTTDPIIALDEAKSNLANTVRQVATLFERVDELKAEKAMRENERIKAFLDFMHRKNLVEDKGVSKEEFQHAEIAYLTSNNAVEIVEHQLNASLAEIENTTPLTHPLVEEAKENVRSAFVNLQRCEIRSPTHGMIALRSAQVGEAVNPTTSLMILVPLDQMWVNANYKETQLANVRIGQPVTMTADLYGGSVVFNGSVEGITAGTGSVFSLLPPQNATGNWIKIVQRLPVRIRLVPEEFKKHPLRLGLSMTVTVDTHHRDGPTVSNPLLIHCDQRAEPVSDLRADCKEVPLYYTNIFESQLEGVEELISKIIQENTTFVSRNDSK